MIPKLSSLVSRGEHYGIITKRHKLAYFKLSSSNEGSNKLNIIVTDGETRIIQTIELNSAPVTFGFRRYLLCSCGKQANSLYLKDSRFACRHCHNLAYEITRLKKGTLNYKLNRNIKIQSVSKQVRNIIYGKVGHTKKARQVMAMISKYC